MADSARSGHMLEGDGIVSNLYYYLWKKRVTADTTGVGMDQQATAELCIPSTVIFEHNFPKAWYYHMEQTKDIERKLGKDVDSQQILREFTKHHSGRRRGAKAGEHSDAVERQQAAANVGIIDDDGDLVATYYSLYEDSKTGKTCTRVEFFDKDELEHFLLRRARRPDGFLQKWVLSTGKHNTVVQAIWSPHVCLVNKRQNCAPIRDKTKALYDRAVTYEGPTHYSTEVFVAPHIKWQVKCVCEELVEHLAKTQRIAISRMVLYFKVDHNSDIWLLYCSSLRVTDRSQLNLAPNYIRDHKDETKEEAMTARRIAKLLKDTFDEGDIGSTTPTGRNSPLSGGEGSAEGGIESGSIELPLNGNASKGIGGTRIPHIPLSAEDEHPLHPSRRPGIRRPTTTASRKPRRPKEPVLRGAFGNTLEGMKWPKPPSMGSIGDIYSEYPNWTKRQQEMEERSKCSVEYTMDGRKEQYRPRRKRFDVMRSDGSIQKAYETPEPLHKWKGHPESGASHDKKSSKRRAGRKNRSSPRPESANPRDTTGGGISPFQHVAGSRTHTTIVDPAELAFPIAPYPEPRNARLLWRILKLAVRSGFAVRRHHRAQFQDWVMTMQYCVYSHFLSHRTPMMLHVPIVYGKMMTKMLESKKQQDENERKERESARQEHQKEVNEQVAEETLQRRSDEGQQAIMVLALKANDNAHSEEEVIAVAPADAASGALESFAEVQRSQTESNDSTLHIDVRQGLSSSAATSLQPPVDESKRYMDWLTAVGLEIEVTTTEGVDVMYPGGSSLSDAVISVRVLRLNTTFLEIQANIRVLMKQRLESSFVVLWWYYVAHHWLMTRNYLRPTQTLHRPQSTTSHAPPSSYPHPDFLHQRAGRSKQGYTTPRQASKSTGPKGSTGFSPRHPKR